MSDEREYWLDDPRNVNIIVYTLYAVCAALAIGDLFYEKHTEYGFERVFGFFGWYGFVGCVGLVLAAKVLRRIVGRSETYYGDFPADSDEPGRDEPEEERGAGGVKHG